MHRHTTRLSSTDLPGAPLLTAVCVSPSPQQPPGSGAAKNNENSEATRQDEKLLAANVSNYMPQVSPPGGHPATRKSRKTARRTEKMAKPTKTRKNTGQEPNAVRRPAETGGEPRQKRTGNDPKEPRDNREQHGAHPRRRRDTPPRPKRTQQTHAQETTHPGKTRRAGPRRTPSPPRARKGTTTPPPPRAIANAHIHNARKQHSGSRHNFGARDPFPD